ncbi:MAG: MFS transporter [Sphingomonadales bacterium]|nr:MFS transporter [Sphingomonadales bacterium]
MTGAQQSPPPPGAWRMAALALLMQNSATGLTFGSFGAIVLAIQSQFHTTRTYASLGVSLAVVTLSLLAPFLGTMLVRRVPIRRVMIAGLLLGAAGYALLAWVSDIRALLAIYLLIIGPSLVMFGALPSNTLVSSWFGDRPGRALGLVNMPLFVSLVPLASAAILGAHGLSAVFACVAVTHLIVLPFAFAVRDGPYAAAGPGKDLGAGSGAILARPEFWLLAVGGGIIVGAGIMKISHLVAIVTGQGHSAATATMLLAISGGAGMLGSPLFGWLADRIGGVGALIANALLQSATFFILLAPVGVPALVVDAVLIGACGAGVSATQGVIFSHLFGPANFARVFGLMSIATLPFLFGMTPLAGLLYDRSGSYALPVAVTIAMLFTAALVLLPLLGAERRLRRPAGFARGTGVSFSKE